MHAYFHLLATTFLVLVLSGCPQPELPAAPGRVIGHGTVTLDGAPLEWGTILFANQDSAAPSADANFMAAVSRGKFKIEIIPGTYRVEIRQEKCDPDQGTPDSPGPSIQLLPKKYNLESELTAEINNENNGLEFSLTSPRKK